MLARDYLNLTLVRLKNGEQWAVPDSSLSLVFPTGGIGELRPVLEGASHQDDPHCGCTELHRGDVLVLNGRFQGGLCIYPRTRKFEFSTFSLSVEHLFPLFVGRDIALLRTVTDTFGVAKHYPSDCAVALECGRLLADAPPHFDIDHRSQLLRVASALLAHEFRNLRGQRSEQVDEHISKLLETFSVTDIVGRSVEELALKLGCTTRHLNRLFHQHFGCSMASFKMEMRLLKAASLLCDPSSKVIRVASACGFNFPGQFYSCFKRRFGINPRQWREARGVLNAAENKPAEQDPSCRIRALGLCPWGGTSVPSGDQRVSPLAEPESVRQAVV